MTPGQSSGLCPLLELPVLQGRAVGAVCNLCSFLGSAFVPAFVGRAAEQGPVVPGKAQRVASWCLPKHQLSSMAEQR